MSELIKKICQAGLDGEEEEVLRLLDEGASPMETTRMGNNAMHLACLHGLYRVADRLMLGVQSCQYPPELLTEKNLAGHTPLMELVLPSSAAVSENQWSIFQKLVALVPTDNLTAIDEVKMSLVLHCGRNYRYRELDCLLAPESHRSLADYAEPCSGMNALHFCCFGKASEAQCETAKILLAYSFDPNAPNHSGHTPIGMARTQNNDELVNLLMS